MVQVSMIGYAATGAFLSLSYFDLPYNFAAVAVLALHFVRKAEAARAGPAATARFFAAPPAPRPSHQPAVPKRPAHRPPQP